MPLSIKQIEETISYMDDTYDANFGSWIRNEDNCKIVGSNLRKYLYSYRESEFITVLKWIVRDWTLRSIILLSKRLIMENITNNVKNINIINDEYEKKIRILSGLIYTWNPIFISEFILAITMEIPSKQRIELMVSVLNVFESKKLSEILSQIEDKVDSRTRKELFKKFKESIYLITKDEWKRRSSMLEAFNAM